jgi:Fe-S oxidoreductase
MSEEKYSSLEEYYNDIVDQTISECTLCGECISNCNLFQSTPLKDKDPEDIIKKTIDLLKDGVFSEEVYHKAYACSSCGYCSESCPQGIDIMEAFGAARSKLVQQGKFPEAVNFVEAIPGLWGTVSALQTRPVEATWFRKVPSRKEKTENVVFLGCTLPASPHTVFALLDVFERMKIDFVALSGGDLCCGFPFFAAGKLGGLEEKARELVTSVKAFSPKRVILPCAGCYRQFTKLYPKFQDLNFEVNYYAQFLTENLKNSDFTKPLDKTVYYHSSCMSQSNRCNDMVESLLGIIPGLKVVKGKPVCCGGTPSLAFPEVADKLAPTFRKSLSEESEKANADYLVNLCQLCELTFSAAIGEYPFGLKDVPALVNEALGGKQYKSKWPELWKCQSGEEIIEKSRENFEQNGLTEEQVSYAVPLILSWKR